MDSSYEGAAAGLLYSSALYSLSFEAITVPALTSSYSTKVLNKNYFILFYIIGGSKTTISDSTFAIYSSY